MHSLCTQLRSPLKRHPKVSTHNTIPQLWPSCLGCDLKIFLGAGFAHFDRQDVGWKSRKMEYHMLQTLDRELQLCPGGIKTNILTGVGWQD